MKAAKNVKMEGPVSVAKMPDGMSPGQLTSLQIKELMANAQKTIEERKKQLEIERRMKIVAGGSAALHPPGVVVPQVVLPPVGLVTSPELSTVQTDAQFDG